GRHTTKTHGLGHCAKTTRNGLDFTEIIRLYLYLQTRCLADGAVQVYGGLRGSHVALCKCDLLRCRGISRMNVSVDWDVRVSGIGFDGLLRSDSALEGCIRARGKRVEGFAPAGVDLCIGRSGEAEILRCLRVD